MKSFYWKLVNKSADFFSGNKAKEENIKNCFFPEIRWTAQLNGSHDILNTDSSIRMTRLKMKAFSHTKGFITSALSKSDRVSFSTALSS